jgi:hypothetical protein
MYVYYIYILSGMHPQVMGCDFHQLMLMLEVEFMAGDGLDFRPRSFHAQDNLEPLAVLPGPHYNSSSQP